MIDKTSYR